MGKDANLEQDVSGLVLAQHLVSEVEIVDNPKKSSSEFSFGTLEQLDLNNLQHAFSN